MENVIILYITEIPGDIPGDDHYGVVQNRPNGMFSGFNFDQDTDTLVLAITNRQYSFFCSTVFFVRDLLDFVSLLISCHVFFTLTMA